MKLNPIVLLSALVGLIPVHATAQAQPCAIRVELNSVVVVPFKFTANSMVHVTASGRVLWNVADNIECSPDGSPGATSFLSPPLPSANRGALLFKSNRGFGLLGSDGIARVGSDGDLDLFVNDGYPIDNQGKFVAIVGNKPLDPGYDLAAEVARSNGKLPWSVNQRFGNYMWSERRDEQGGHQYLTISPIDAPNIGVRPAADLLKKKIADIFPGTAVGSKGPTVTEGNEFTLVVNAPFAPKVRAVAVGAFSFTFQTLPGHPLQGTATHGVFEDSTGRLYMFQQGRGVAGETLSQQRFNLNIAPQMWKWASDNLGRLIRKLYS